MFTYILGNYLKLIQKLHDQRCARQDASYKHSLRLFTTTLILLEHSLHITPLLSSSISHEHLYGQLPSPIPAQAYPAFHGLERIRGGKLKMQDVPIGTDCLVWSPSSTF